MDAGRHERWTMTTMTVEPTITRGAYAGLWRTVPREVAYLLIAYPISIVAFSVTISLFSAGAGTLVTFFIGVLFFIAVLYVARGFGVLELALLRFAGRAAIDEPDWMDRRARKGFFGWLRAVLGNGHYWLYLLYTMVVDFILKTISWTVIVTWISTGLGGHHLLVLAAVSPLRRQLDGVGLPSDRR